MQQVMTSAFGIKELHKMSLSYRHPIGGQSIAGLLKMGKVRTSC